MSFNKILIIGATGRTGIEVVKESLARKYETYCLVRSPEKLNEYKNQVQIFIGDATNLDKVEIAVKEADAVISVIGPTKNSLPGMQAQATQTIVDAMKKYNKRRLITMTGAGVRTEGDNPQLVDKLIRGVMLVMARKALDDGIGHAEVVKNSDLDWTIVRGPRLSDDPGTGKYVHGMVGDSQMTTQIARADVAKFIFDILEDESMYNKMPMVSWRKAK